jgi:hypothetical protein
VEKLTQVTFKDIKDADALYEVLARMPRLTKVKFVGCAEGQTLCVPFLPWLSDCKVKGSPRQVVFEYAAHFNEISYRASRKVHRGTIVRTDAPLARIWYREGTRFFRSDDPKGAPFFRAPPPQGTIEPVEEQQDDSPSPESH